MKIRWRLPFLPGSAIFCILTRRRLCCIFILPLFLLLIILYSSSFFCWNDEGAVVLNTICEQVNNGLALGDMCREVCESQTVTPVSCQPSHGGKDVVFNALFHNSQDVVVKARSLDLNGESQGSVYYNDETGEEQFPSVDEFTTMIASHLALNMNLSLTENTLYRLWPAWVKSRESFSDAQNKMLLDSSMKNIWTLALDPEYVLARLFKHYDVFPELYGSCGGAYIVEKVKPLPSTSFIQPLSFPNFVIRAKIAVTLLDLLEELDTMFTSPLHLCDIKLEHFGISDNGRIKYLDLDSVQLKPLVDKTVGDGTDCDQHSDCHFLDCQGRCDFLSRRCRGDVANNNLQVVCEKILLGEGHFGLGLLASKHASRSLANILQDCANPLRSTDSLRIAAGQEIRDSLYTSLQEIIEMGARVGTESD